MNLSQITNPLLQRNPTPGTSEGDFLSSVLSSLITLGFILACILFIFMIIWGAIQWILSGGDKGAVQGAQGKIQHAIIGLVLLLSSFAIISLVGYFFNIEALSTFNIDFSSLKLP